VSGLTDHAQQETVRLAAGTRRGPVPGTGGGARPVGAVAGPAEYVHAGALPGAPKLLPATLPTDPRIDRIVERIVEALLDVNRVAAAKFSSAI
jgi:hypothetical protein